MVKNKIFLSVTFLFFLLLCTSCDNGFSFDAGNKKVHVVSWNVQTFFDGVTSGNEYSEFKGSKSKWNEDLYNRRLNDLCSAIQEINPDILVLQEIENEGVMYDISNRLTGFQNSKNSYQWMAFRKSPDSSIGCGVFSRIPIKNVLHHQVDCRIYGEQPSLRPLMEVALSWDEKSGKEVSLFICHWKSKYGGKEVAAKWQQQQGELLGWRLAELEKIGKANAIICGDFNCGIEEFIPYEKDLEKVYIGNIAVKSGWLLETTVSKGSYWYKDTWEKIDHIFSFGNVNIKDFTTIESDLWTELHESGEIIPHRYSVWKGNGFSDHLPVSAWVFLKT